MKLLNLSNWLTGLVESFTFYGGGGQVVEVVNYI
jgi:hypothetical protein